MIFGELEHLYHQPLLDLISQSRAVHLQHWRGEEIQRCSLLSTRRVDAAKIALTARNPLIIPPAVSVTSSCPWKLF